VKCSRCNLKLNPKRKGWTKCPKCGLSTFVGGKRKPKKEKPEIKKK